MKNKDLFQIFEGIQSVDKLKGAKFAYAMAKNKRVLVAEIEDLEKAAKMSESFEEFDNERVELCEKHSKKDAEGKTITKGNDLNPKQMEYVIEDRKAFDVELEKLSQKHQEAVDEREKQMKEYAGLLNKPINGVNFHKIAREDLPEDISIGQTENILELIED